MGISLSAVADPYSQCAQILQNGLFDTKKIIQDKSKKKYALAWLCSQNYQASGSEKGVKLEGAYKAISGKVDYTKSKFSEYKNDHCNFDTSSYSAVEKSYMYSQIASPAIVSAWENCIASNNQGLVCSAEEINSSEAIFKVKMHYGQQGGLTQVKMQKKNLKDAFDNSLGGVIKMGDEYLFNLERPNVKNTGLVMITGKSEKLGTSTYCNYRIPVTVNIPLPDTELSTIKSLVSAENYDSKDYAKVYYPQPENNCIVKVNEKLTIKNVSVSKDKSNIHVAYSCTQNNHRWACHGGGFSGPTNKVTAGKVSGKISIVGGIMSISDLVTPNDNPEQKCGKTVADYLRSLDGTAL